MLGNAERMDLRDRLQQRPAKLAAVSKIAQGVGTAGNPLSSCLLMELTCC